MQDFQTAFIDFAISQQVLKFGEFTLKSGRISPYFFNAGLFQTGEALARLSEYYAEAIVDAELEFDMLFGPAYKGIPLVSAIAMQLYMKHGRNYPYAYNRKEAKNHGEGGVIVGAPLNGKVLVVDDVITAGTAIREAADIIQSSQASLGGVVISLDRQERGTGELSAIQEVEQDYNIPVASIIGFNNIIEYASTSSFDQSQLDKITAYRQDYGI